MAAATASSMRMMGFVRMMRRALVAIGLTLVLVVPEQAMAHQVLTLPGKAGANEYFETVPTSGGNAAPPGFDGSGNNGTNAIAHLGHGRVGVARLSHLGNAGAAAAALAASTAPSSAIAGGSEHGTARRELGRLAQSYAVNQPPGQSASSALESALTGSDDGGLGVILPLLLGAAVLVAIGLGVFRTRRHTRPPDLTA